MEKDSSCAVVEPVKKGIFHDERWLFDSVEGIPTIDKSQAPIGRGLENLRRRHIEARSPDAVMSFNRIVGP